MKLYSFTLKENESRTDLIGKLQDVNTSPIAKSGYDGSQPKYMVGCETIKELIDELKAHDAAMDAYSIIEVSDDENDTKLKFDNGCFFVFTLVRFIPEEEVKLAIAD